MTRIKEHYFGFWTGGRPCAGDWYDGFVSEWHGPLEPRAHARRYYQNRGMAIVAICSLYALLTVLLILLHKPNWYECGMVIMLAVLIELRLRDKFVESTYIPFSLCPHCRTGLWTADVYSGFKNHSYHGSFQRCPNCGFRKEPETITGGIFIIMSPPIREHARAMLKEVIPPPCGRQTNPKEGADVDGSD